MGKPKDTYVETLASDLTKEDAEAEQANLAKTLTESGMGSTHYVAVTQVKGFLYRSYSVTLWERGR